MSSDEELERLKGEKEEITAKLDDIADTTAIHRDIFPVNQALITSLDTKTLPTLFNPSAYHSSDGSIHARGIATAGQNTNSFNHLLTHAIYLSARTTNSALGAITKYENRAKKSSQPAP